MILYIEGAEMSKEQAVKDTQNAFVTALDAGVEEDALIEALFESKAQRDRKQRILKCIRELFAEDSRNFMDICHGATEK
jgi:hypothetical protein